MLAQFTVGTCTMYSLPPGFRFDQTVGNALETQELFLQSRVRGHTAQRPPEG
jgi:hypothetical protein